VAAALVLESLGIDAVEALLGLGSGQHCAAVALACAPSIRLRRFVAVARHAARSRPVLTVLAPGHARDWAEQAGLEVVPDVAHLMDRSAELLSGARALDWLPPDRGQIVELSDCDIAGARTALDQAGGSGVDTDGAPRRLPPALAEGVLAAYGIRGDPLQTRPARSEQNFILEDRPEVGLCAGFERQRTRLLPLTDRDAAELVEAAGVGRAGAEPAIEVLLRAARLMDDQPDVARIEIAPRDVQRAETWAGVAMWSGPVRSTDDDPLVRRLARPVPA
jgi:hypothetical protein